MMIIPTRLLTVVMAIISPRNILYISVFLTPMALYMPISFILERNEDLVISKISMRDMAIMIRQINMLAEVWL